LNFTASSSELPVVPQGPATWPHSSPPSPSQGHFGGTDLYPTLIEKAAALCFVLVRSHPFIDGNKRTGHAAMETFLVLNGAEIDAPVDEQERLMLDLAAGRISRSNLVDWLSLHVKPPE
jgi:death-on-curing protein